MNRPTKSVLGVCRIARDPAKVEDQVRFLAWTLIELDARQCAAVGQSLLAVGAYFFASSRYALWAL